MRGGMDGIEGIMRGAGCGTAGIIGMGRGGGIGTLLVARGTLGANGVGKTGRGGGGGNDGATGAAGRIGFGAEGGVFPLTGKLAGTGGV